jgi:hypothetical protein
MGLVSAAFYLIFTKFGSNLLLALIGSIGLMIAFYYGLTGFVCAWYYRKTFTKTARDLLMQGVIPLLGGLIMLATFVYGLKQFLAPDWLVDGAGKNITLLGAGAVGVVGVLALLLGVIAMAAQWITSPGYFRGETLPMRGAHDLVLAGPAGATDLSALRLPDSGLPDTVIAPDLSNLPPGATAINPETGEEFRRS